ncbi:hypothetical protein GQ602_004823 [Ophiocordyceps camponoti-floridani]|uniref:Uncharacterized protein n=1 Tax=Ophiocordyceps camponoti-floridani TaxID=2030778 RepID=A0A8H4Q4I0_9HYPO|nr:hypothetical protein GQ602_004823 [Ophiocordyceps camponoti-floridani]
MDDANPNPLLAALAFVVRIRWASHLIRIVRLIFLPVRLAIAGLSRIASVLAVVFAPAVYIFALCLWLSKAVVALILGLEPLYKFFSVAVTIGITSGIILALTSSLITNLLGMQDDPDVSDRQQKLQLEPSPAVPPSWESDWFWAESSSPQAKRRQPSGLLSQTIHEEDSDI